MDRRSILAAWRWPKKHHPEGKMVHVLSRSWLPLCWFCCGSILFLRRPPFLDFLYIRQKVVEAIEKSLHYSKLAEHQQP